MPKLHIPLDEFTIMNKAQEIWRRDRMTANTYSANPTPFDEPTLKALVKALVESINEAVDRAIVTLPENDGLAHLSVFHPVDGWVPLCKAGMFVTGNCLECSNKAKPQ